MKKKTALEKYKLHYELVDGDASLEHPNARSKKSIQKMVQKWARATLYKGD